MSVHVLHHVGSTFRVDSIALTRLLMVLPKSRKGSFISRLERRLARMGKKV